MKKIYLSLLSVASFAFVDIATANDVPIAHQSHTSTQFSAEQVTDIKKILTEYINQNPDIVMTAFQAGMENKQKDELAKVEKAVVANKDKIFNNKTTPVGGNPQGTESLVIFMDPYCGYCKKFHGEIDTILSSNKDVKIRFIDIPIMGPESNVAVKAMLAAKAQGKYDQLQKAIFSADKQLSKKQILKIAKSLGIDTKQLETDMRSKEIQAQVDRNSDLAKVLGINGTPTLIIGESTVVPGFLTAEEVNKKLKETAAAAPTPTTGTAPNPTPEKPS